MITIYGDIYSGNCYKIKLLANFIGLPHCWQKVDILAQETQTPAFAEINPNQRIPAIQLENGEFLSESNAILNYLAEGTLWLPGTPLQRAKILQWQFFEQYSHEPYIATARYLNRYLGLPTDRLDEYLSKQPGGHKALAVMEKQLNQTSFLTGKTPTIADISLFAYTHVADEGGFDLNGYPCIRRWLQDFAHLPGFISMEAAAATLTAQSTKFCP